LYECSASKINFFCIESEYKPTGMVVAGDKIYFTDISDYFSDISDKGGLSSYTIKSENDSCDDNSNNIYDQDCACIEKPACKSDLQISSNNDDNNNMLNSLDVNYSSSQSISTQFDETNDNPDIIIQKNEAVNLMSDHITLNVGFKVENGACLNATIEPCE